MSRGFLPWEYIQNMDGAVSLNDLQELMDEDDPNAWDRFNEALTPEEADEIVSQYRFSPRHHFRTKFGGSKKLEEFIEGLYRRGGSKLVDRFYATNSEESLKDFIVDTLMSFHK